MATSRFLIKTPDDWVPFILNVKKNKRLDVINLWGKNNLFGDEEKMSCDLDVLD
jgi:hypothetical protein